MDQTICEFPDATTFAKSLTGAIANLDQNGSLGKPLVLAINPRWRDTANAAVQLLPMTPERWDDDFMHPRVALRLDELVSGTTWHLSEDKTWKPNP